jgi:hypothetical protein
VTAAVDQVTDLVESAEVADAWQQESALPGMTVGGLARHLVSQAECAVEFLITPGPPDAQVLTLVGHYDRVDWWHARVDAAENTSIRDEFNQMGSAGHAESVEVLARSREHLGSAIDAAGPATYLPWQDCAVPTDFGRTHPSVARQPVDAFHGRTADGLGRDHRQAGRDLNRPLLTSLGQTHRTRPETTKDSPVNYVGLTGSYR